MQWDYLSVRFSYKGRGITQEFEFLKVDGEHEDDTLDEDDDDVVSSLPELLVVVGEDGWELVTHVILEGLHYMHFKRPRDASSEPQVPL